MPQTYTSQWFRVSNSEITTHNPQALASTDAGIRILDAEIQREGVDAQIEQEVTKTDANTNTHNFDGGTGRVTVMYATHPSVNGSVQNHTVTASDQLTDAGSGSIQVTAAWGDEKTDAIPGGFASIGTTSGDYQGQTSNVAIDVDEPFSDGSVEIEANTTYQTTETVTKSTTDPRVTRDVLAESDGLTLAAGEQSSWYQLDGLDPNSEEVYHDLDGSREARFRFRFDWEKAVPDPTYGVVGFYDDSAGVWYECAVADAADDQLEYDHVRVYNAEQNAWGVLDVVTPTHKRAIESHQFYDPDAGWLAPRQYSATAP